MISEPARISTLKLRARPTTIASERAAPAPGVRDPEVRDPEGRDPEGRDPEGRASEGPASAG
jgi:hypothetical protein